MGEHGKRYLATIPDGTAGDGSAEMGALAPQVGQFPTSSRHHGGWSEAGVDSSLCRRGSL